MALGSTQPLTELSPRNLSEGEGGPAIFFFYFEKEINIYSTNGGDEECV
jgi:hypothetical protein